MKDCGRDKKRGGTGEMKAGQTFLFRKEVVYCPPITGISPGRSEPEGEVFR